MCKCTVIDESDAWLLAKDVDPNLCRINRWYCGRNRYRYLLYLMNQLGALPVRYGTCFYNEKRYINCIKKLVITFCYIFLRPLMRKIYLYGNSVTNAEAKNLSN